MVLILLCSNFKSGNVVQTLTIEIKNYTGNVNLGSLGKGKFGDYGGSIRKGSVYRAKISKFAKRAIKNGSRSDY